MVLVILLTTREDTRKLEPSSAHGSAEHLPHRTCGTQPWTITNFLVSFESRDHLNKNEDRGSPKVAGNSLRELQLSLTHSIGWRDEELHHLCATRIAALKQQEYAQWPEERTSSMELHEWWDKLARETSEQTDQILLTCAMHPLKTAKDASKCPPQSVPEPRS